MVVFEDSLSESKLKSTFEIPKHVLEMDREPSVAPTIDPTQTMTLSNFNVKKSESLRNSHKGAKITTNISQSNNQNKSLKEDKEIEDLLKWSNNVIKSVRSSYEKTIKEEPPKTEAEPSTHLQQNNTLIQNI